MKKSNPLIIFICGIFIFVPPGLTQETGERVDNADAAGKMTLTSPAFQAGEMIPPLYTCDDKDISPPLRWSQAPKGTQSFALIMDDPDAPMGTWVHWVLYNLPPTVDMLPEALPGIRKLANAEKQGHNSSGEIGYAGPCPPSGTHRYYFKMYALDTALLLEGDVTKQDLLKAMEGHILAEAELMARYER